MKHIKVPTHFTKKNTDTLNTGNHAEAAIQYKNQKSEVRIKIWITEMSGLRIQPLSLGNRFHPYHDYLI